MSDDENPDTEAPEEESVEEEAHDKHEFPGYANGFMAVFGWLVFFTVLEVMAILQEFSFGATMFILFSIAFVKVWFIASFFMHLRWDRPYNAIILVGSLLFLGIFLGFALLDTGEYNPSLIDDPFLKINAEQFGNEQG